MGWGTVIVQIKPWKTSDTDWWVGLRFAGQPIMGEAQVWLLAAGKIARFEFRAVAWIEGARVGFASLAQPPGRDDTIASVLVPDDRRGGGIGSALFAELLPKASGRSLLALMPDDNETSLAVAQHWGFEVVSHAVRSRLDLASAQTEPVGDGGRTITDPHSPLMWC
jgi:GNAT superfamily N-acetyltransferase